LWVSWSSSRLDEARARVALHSDSHAYLVDDSPATDRELIFQKGSRGGRGKLLKRIEKAAKSPKAKKFEQDMVRKAKDPKTQAKISKGFRDLRAKH